MEKKQENDDYSFMQEQIKKRPINKKKLFKRAFMTGALAIMFGVIASFVFILLEPALTKLVSPKEEKPSISLPEVTLPEEVNEVLPEDMIQEQVELDEKDKPAETIVQNNNIIQKLDLEIEDYQNLYGKLSDLAQEVNESMVVVMGSFSDVDWFSNVYEEQRKVSGLMVADNGRDLYIISNYSALAGATEFEVIFSDDSVCPGTVSAYDKATNLIVISVPLSAIDPEIRANLTYATLGNSNVGIREGDPINTTDHNYKLITTDIYGSRNAEGFLCNTKGQVIGVLNQKYNNSDLSNQISAIGISELKHLIEDLSNQVERPYFGTTLLEITPQAIANGIPEGAFVRKLEMDSPAMEVGIVAGDIITGIDGVHITSAAEAEEKLRHYKPGDEVDVKFMRSAGDEYKEVNVTVTIGQKTE